MFIKEIGKRFIRTINGEVSLKTLIKRGLILGDNFSKQSGCYIDSTFPFLITIKDNVTFSKNVHVLSHDASTKRTLGFTKLGKVTIGNNTFVGANVTILPNVSIGDNSIIGAGSVITKSFAENSVIAGNPAKVVGTTQDYYNKMTSMMNHSNVFGEDCLKHNRPKKEVIKKIQDECDKSIGFIY